jgi:O-antigen/teichoic acid export membrane protein
MSKYRRLGENIFLISAGKFGSNLISFLMLPFYTSWLSREDYGITDLISVYASILISIVTCCLADAIFVFPKNQSDENKTKYFTTALLCSLLGLLFTGLIFFVLSVFNDDSDSFFCNYSLYIYLFIFVSFFQTFLQQFTRSIDKMNVYVISGVLLTVFAASLSFVLIPEYGLMGYISAQITAMILTCLYTIVHAKLYKYISFNAFFISAAKEMLKYTVPTIPNATMWWLINSSNRFFLEKYKGLEDIGIYAVASKFPSLIAILYGIFFTSWQISVLDEYNKEGYANFYNKIARAFFLVIIFAVIILSSLSYLLTYYFVDEKFIESWKYIPVIALAIPFSSMSGFVGTNFMATGTTKYFFLSSIWGAVTCVLFNMLLIPLWGIMGAAIGAIFAHLVMLVYHVKYAEQFVVLKYKINYLLSLTALSLITFLIPVDMDIILKTLFCLILTGCIFFANKDVIQNIPLIITKLIR